MKRPRAFISFGHDRTAPRELESFLKSVGLTPCLLADEDDGGITTVIEKFERYAKNCAVAFVLLTPDDLTASGEKRARQNVLFELGWFCRDLGRDRVIALLKGTSVEIPSNLSGVLFLRFTASVFDVTPQISRRLRVLGVIPEV